MKIGIIGMGAVTQRSHLPALKFIKEATIVGFCETNKEVIALFKDKYQFCSSINDLFSLKPELVIIATPSSSHSEIAIKAVAHNISCLVEKPIALSVAQTLDIEAQLLKTTARVFTGLHFRHTTQIQNLKTIIDSDKFGKLISVQATFTNHINRRKTISGYEKARNSGGGVLYDLAYHHADLIKFLTGNEAVEVCSKISSIVNEDDTASMQINFGGIIANCFYSSHTHNEHSIKFFFEKGIIMIDFYRSTSLFISSGKNSILDKIISELKYAFSMISIAKSLLPRYKALPFIKQFSYLLAKNNLERNNVASFSDGVAALKVIEAAYKSNKTNKWESV